MAIDFRALAGAAILLVACGSPSFTAAGDGGGADDTGAPSDGGATSDAAQPDDGAADAGGGGPIVCPGSPNGTCEAHALCCIYKADNGGGSVATCQGTGAKCSGQGPSGSNGEPTQLACTRSAQCSLEVCCIVKNGGGNPAISSCTTLAQCAATGAVLCEMAHPNCPGGLSACGAGADASWGIPTDLGTCGGAGPR